MSQWNSLARNWALLCVAAVCLGGCLDASGTPAALAVLGFLEPQISGNTAARVGDVLVAGGMGSTGVVPNKTAELFNPATKTFALTGALPSPVAAATAVSFATGPLAHRTLVPGGLTGKMTLTAKGFSYVSTTLATAEDYQDSTGLFRATGRMVTPRYLYTATLLQNGKVLVAGGLTGLTPTAKAELYDPATQKFTATGAMATARAMHAAALLNDGTVLIVGGIADNNGDTVASAEIYNPSTGLFTPTTGNLPASAGEAGLTATLISGCGCVNDGSVLIAGGFTGGLFAVPSSTNSLSMYSPTTKTFRALRAMRDERVFHTATLVSLGRVLITGGYQGQALVKKGVVSQLEGRTLNTAEVFTAKTQVAACVGGQVGAHCKPSMKGSRAGHAAVLVNTGILKGDVLLTGGIDSTPTVPAVQNTAEIYSTAAGAFVAVGAMKNKRAFHAAALIQ